MTITPTDLIAAGMKSDKHFPAAVQAANETLAKGGSFDEAIAAARLLQAPPVTRLQGSPENLAFDHQLVDDIQHSPRRGLPLAGHRLHI